MSFFRPWLSLGPQLTNSGNQGTDFRYVPREGFGWMNAAYQVGLQFLSIGMRRAVAACVPVSYLFEYSVQRKAEKE